MTSSLAQAWAWYMSVKETALTMRALGKHWTVLPWDGDLGRNERLRHIDAANLEEWTKTVLADLDDLCILLLFSVFEAVVRERALADVAAEAPAFNNPHLQKAVASLNETLEQGSFFRVLDAYQVSDPDLVEQLQQIRRYRNWVAHGRRGTPAAFVDPHAAYDRLQRFLTLLAGS